MIDYDDWCVSKKILNFIDRLWGPHSIDRFANYKNKKQFNFKYWCPETKAFDAFSQDMTGENNWLIPPIHLISKTIRYLKSFSCEATLIVPLWESAPFWPLLFKNSKDCQYFVKRNMFFF